MPLKDALRNGVRYSLFAGLIFPIALNAANAADKDESDKAPPLASEYSLTSGRDYLRILNEITDDLASEKYIAAGNVANDRFAPDNIDLHGASQRSPALATRMKAARIILQKSASHFAIVAQNADVDRSYEALLSVQKAFDAMLSACNACHSAYKTW